jgi:hypothetical protein
MLASVVLEHSEVAFAEGYVGFVVAGCGVDSEAAYVEDSKDRVLVAISLKTYMQTTLALTSSKAGGLRMDGYSGPPSGPAAQFGGGGYSGGYDAEPSQQIMVRNVCSPIPDLILQPLTGDSSYHGQLLTKILSSSSKPPVKSNSPRFCLRALAPREWVSFNFPISLRRKPQSVSACALHGPLSHHSLHTAKFQNYMYGGRPLGTFTFSDSRCPALTA